MNAARAAILLAAAAILSGCATRTKHPADSVRRSAFTPVQERPGLGTAWGEQRDSWVEPLPFARSSGDRPACQDRIYYNDREGVNAMLDFIGGTSRQCDGLQQSAGGSLRFGVRKGSGPWVETHEMRGRRFAVGEHGERYEVVVKNDARRAVEILVSVDGLDVTDGKPASFKKRGYVLAPFETLAVDGFRTSNATVAAFRFGSMFDSYGRRRHGNTTNAGVIGVAVFEEQRRKAPAAAIVPDDHAWRSIGTRPPAFRDGFAPPPEA